MRKNDLEEASHDYEALKRTFPNSYPVLYGLQEIAYRKNRLAEAGRYGELYLKFAPTNTDEAKLVRDRLKTLAGRPR